MDFSKERDDDAMETSGLSIMSLGMDVPSDNILCLVMSFEVCHSVGGRSLWKITHPKKISTKKCLKI